MSASQLVARKVAGIEPSRVFTIEDLGFPRESWENVRVKLGRMVKSGEIEKAGRGKYFKPKTSVFGKIGPSPEEMVKDLLYENGNLTGYVTGYGIWNRMGLTSQISNVIVIGTSRRRDSFKRGKYEIRFMSQPNRVSVSSIPLLQLLDSIKLIKQIPDASVSRSVRILKRYISELEAIQLLTLVKLARKYPPRVRALLGAILESIRNFEFSEVLKNTLNPATVYAMGLNELEGVNLNDWNIK